MTKTKTVAIVLSATAAMALAILLSLNSTSDLANPAALKSSATSIDPMAAMFAGSTANSTSTDDNSDSSASTNTSSTINTQTDPLAAIFLNSSSSHAGTSDNAESSTASTQQQKKSNRDQIKAKAEEDREQAKENAQLDAFENTIKSQLATEAKENAQLIKTENNNSEINVTATSVAAQPKTQTQIVNLHSVAPAKTLSKSGPTETFALVTAVLGAYLLRRKNWSLEQF